MFSSNTSQVAATATQAEAIDYDGTNDWLSRGDLVGNTDGQTFTFSGWVWINASATNKRIYAIGDTGVSDRFYVEVTSANVTVAARNSAGTTILSGTASAPFSGLVQTFAHILISVDLANTSNRSIYVNDIAQTVTWATYTNSSIDFTMPVHAVARSAASTTSDRLNGRASNFFLDKTYRNLSVTANRRLFITADLKPAAGQASLNPILYLPLSDPTAPGTNLGTGGNFTLTGTVARSGRGPNQYNVPYSDLDGSVDYLSRTTAPTGIANSKQFTLAFCFSTDDISNGTYIAFFGTGSTERFYMQFNNGTARLAIVARNSSNSTILNALTANNSIVANRNYVVVISIDLSATANRHVYVNGQAASMTWTTYTNDNIQFNITSQPRYGIGAESNLPTGLFNGKIGALWFNTSYIDLSVPANLAKFVTGTGINAKPVDLGANGELPTGTSPLIYLPMYGNNAGKNYGTGGDFTVYSGPYPGARGPNEFWGNKVAFNTSGSLLKYSSLGMSNSDTFSLSTFAMLPNSGTGQVIFANSTSSSYTMRIAKTYNNYLQMELNDASGVRVFEYNSSSTLTSSAIHLAICAKASTGVCAVYVNGVQFPGSVVSGAGTLFNLAYNGGFGIGSRKGVEPIGSGGYLSEFYFTSSFIDFSQEASRLKFRDAFGNPVDLTQQIESLAIPNPAIYMRFPPTSFGTNSGTGGNFSISGTLTDGGQL